MLDTPGGPPEPARVDAGFAPESALAGFAPESALAGFAPESALAGFAPESALAGFEPAAGLSFPPPQGQLTPQGLSSLHFSAFARPLAVPGPATVSIDLFNRTPSPDEAELDWAAAAAGRALSSDEAERLRRITAEYLASRDGLPGPGAQDLDWALEQLRQWQAGQTPSPERAARLRDLLARFTLELQAQLQAQLAALLAQLPSPAPLPSPAERHWACTLKQHALAGQAPSAQDFERFGLILAACIANGLPLEP